MKPDDLKNPPVVSDHDEIKQFEYFGEQFTNKEVLDVLLKIDGIAKDMEVGGQTSYQNKFFVLNPVEFPEGTSGKSRQAAFEASVRVDNLKSLLFEYKAAMAEKKIIEARIMRAERKLQMEDPIDRLEGEGELELAELDMRKKDLSITAMMARSKHILRSVFDFYTEFENNEKICEQRGFNYRAWNKLEVEHDYWAAVNDRKVQKAMAYAKLGMSQQLGDSLPFQNSLNIERIEKVKGLTSEAIDKETKKLENVGDKEE